MMRIPDIKFGKAIYQEHEGKNVYVHSYGKAEIDDYDSYIDALTNEGFEKKEDYEFVRYEGYGPSGMAIMIDCLTDNKNRSASMVRSSFTKRGGNLGTDGSVA